MLELKREESVLLTIDIGTSSFKSSLWDFDGNRLAFASLPLSISVSDGFSHEADCSQWLCAFENCCQKLANGNNHSLASVQAIVISGQGPSLVPVLGEPRVTGEGLSVMAANARLWLDRRAVKYQGEVSELMGGFVDSGFFLPKILALKNEEGGLYNRTKFFLGCPEYLSYALTGQARTVFPSDGFDRWFWNDAVLEKLELDAEKFPAFIRPGDPYGPILPSAAEHFGFAENVPVISGGPDFFAAILGAGVIKPGQACDRTGSSEGVNLCTKDRVNDERLMSYGHPVKPYWNLSGIISTTGKAIEWCRDLLGLSDIEDFFSLAQKSGPGSGGLVFLPYLAGERAPVWDPSARALWRGISLSSGRSDFANSVLEGICFAIRDVITVMEEAGGAGARVGQLHVTGGLAESVRLNQLKADITGREVLEPAQKEAELLGLAIIGACSLGKFASFAEASSAIVRIEKTFEPNLENAALYDRLFGEYKKCQAQLK
jgi:xylulokinase